MKPSERKLQLVKELENLRNVLNVKQLYVLPTQQPTKDWLANVAAVFKNLDENDHQEFLHLSKIISSENREKRRNAANEIDNLVRRKVAEWKRYDFSALDKKEPIKKDMAINYWNFVNPLWLAWRLIVLAWRNKIITIVTVFVSLLGIDYSLAWKNTMWLFNTIMTFIG